MAKKTANGTAMEMKVPVAMRSQLPPKVPIILIMACVMTMVSPEASIRNTLAARRSLNVHRNWTIAHAASAGMLSGRMILINIWKSVAPSSLAFSIIFARYAGHVVAQKKDAEGQGERGMEEPNAQIALTDTDVHM